MGLGAALATAGTWISTNATAIGAVAATVGAVGGIAQGVEGARGARSGRQRQGEAQGKAEAAAGSQRRDNQTAQNKANRKKPDIAGILANARSAGSGLASTNLTGAGGVPTLGNVGRAN